MAKLGLDTGSYPGLMNITTRVSDAIDVDGDDILFGDERVAVIVTRLPTQRARFVDKLEELCSRKKVPQELIDKLREIREDLNKLEEMVGAAHAALADLYDECTEDDN